MVPVFRLSEINRAIQRPAHDVFAWKLRQAEANVFDLSPPNGWMIKQTMHKSPDTYEIDCF